MGSQFVFLGVRGGNSWLSMHDMRLVHCGAFGTVIPNTSLITNSSPIHQSVCIPPAPARPMAPARPWDINHKFLGVVGPISRPIPNHDLSCWGANLRPIPILLAEGCDMIPHGSSFCLQVLMAQLLGQQHLEAERGSVCDHVFATNSNAPERRPAR